MPVMYYILRYFLVKSEGLEKNIKSEGLDSIHTAFYCIFF